eukprot:TRINITY_DN4221_c0_g1_i1.p1 TRINITY_DN4221_c0_g1~~TRINITY_DN4221_c0_g1_i1.p1  ORF type:complete len:590 (-),score=192.04 TRINITY_DN4221_c0_g1_i1:81-1817(-)
MDSLAAELDSLDSLLNSTFGTSQEGGDEIARLNEQIKGLVVKCQTLEKSKNESNAKLVRLISAVKEERTLFEEQIEQEQIRSEQLEQKLIGVINMFKEERAKWQNAPDSNSTPTNNGASIAEIESLKEEISDLESQLNDETNRSSELEHLLSEAQNNLAVVEEELYNTKSNVSEIEEEAALLKRKLQALMSATGKLKNEFDDLRAAYNPDEVAELKLNISNLESQIQQLGANNNHLQQDKERLENQVQQLRNSASSNAADSSQVESLKSQLNDAEVRANEEYSKFSEAENKIAQLEAQITEQDDKRLKLITVVKNERAKMEATKTEIEKARNDAIKKANDESTRSSKLSAQVDELRDQIQELQATNTELQNRPTATQTSAPTPTPTSNNGSDETIRQLENRIQALESAAARAENRADEWERKYNALAAQPAPTAAPAAGGPPPMAPGGGPPPPPHMAGGPPPPPMPTIKGPRKLVINRTGQSAKLQGSSGGGDSAGGAQSELINAIKKGVTLKKTSGPMSSAEKAKRTPPPGAGGMNLAAMASQLARARSKRVQENARNGISYRKSVRLDNLLDELEF